MGAVAVESRTIGRDRGYPFVEATLYIYCDACGSFNIKKYVPFIKILILAVVLAAMAFLAFDNKQSLMCIIPLGLLAMYLPWRDVLLRYKCRKCGNNHITDYNSLKYQSYDKSIVNEPDRSTQKRYIDVDISHFKQFM